MSMPAPVLEQVPCSSTSRREKPSAYTVRLAALDDEIRAAQRLRFEVFNLELQEGLASAYLHGRDEDPFDDYCDHLVVIHLETNQVVGTYRLQTGLIAALHQGYYSAQEFDFAPFETIRHQLIELGRACVHQNHRNLAVLNLLWRGIAQYAEQRNGRYLIGCSSLTSQDPALGAAMYTRLKSEHLVAPEFYTLPLEEYAFDLNHRLDDCPLPPKLLRAYLGLGAKICGPPALDRAFQTIDFLTLLDLQALRKSAQEHFLS
jgi:putative hemolysin